MFIKHLENTQDDTAMVCIDAMSTYAAVVSIKGKSENGLALDMMESTVKMLMHNNKSTYKFIDILK